MKEGHPRASTLTLQSIGRWREGQCSAFAGPRWCRAAAAFSLFSSSRDNLGPDGGLKSRPFT